MARLSICSVTLRLCACARALEWVLAVMHDLCFLLLFSPVQVLNIHFRYQVQHAGAATANKAIILVRIPRDADQIIHGQYTRLAVQ